MLYALHELQKTMTAPLVAWADASQKLFTNPYSPFAYHPLSRTLAASNELLGRLMQSYEKPAWGIERVTCDGVEVAVAIEPVLTKPFCTLLHFSKDTANRGPKLLMFAPLSGHHATLLRDTVRTALQDFDVYITDWTDARLVPASAGPFHFDDYVAYAMEFIRGLGPDLHVMSVCQPTVPVLAAVSLLAQSGDAKKPNEALPKTMIMMGGPIDPRRNPTVVNEFAMGRPYEWFEEKVIHSVPFNYPGFMRRVYPGFLQHFGFIAMNPERHIDAHRQFFNHLVQGDGDSAASHRRFYDEYNAVLDMPAEYYLDTIRIVFQEFALPKGKMVIAGELVRPEAIKGPALFTIEGELDDISGNGQTEAAHTLCRNIAAEKRKHLMAPGLGHYGIFSGRKFREQVYPQIRNFIRRWK